jgi:hypothetical protein
VKRLVSLILMLMLFGSGHVLAGGKAKEPVQHVDGSILFSEHPVAIALGLEECDVDEAIAQSVSRGGFPTGTFGYSFDVDPNSYGKRFRLETSVEGADLDIYFHEHVGYEDKPIMRPPTWAYAEKKPGGESGIVPRDFAHAVVCVEGANDVTFTYTSWRSVNKKKK